MHLENCEQAPVFFSAFTIFAEDRIRFGNLCVQARTIAYTPFIIAAVMGNKFHPLHYLCPKQNGL